jgi:hypothetical protein
VLQLGDQIGFLRSIHANSIFGQSDTLAEVQTKPGRTRATIVRGVGIDGAAMQRTTKRNERSE